jgi:hypothetical protein
MERRSALWRGSLDPRCKREDGQSKIGGIPSGTHASLPGLGQKSKAERAR